MESICPEINALHAAYCEALGYQFTMMAKNERGWYDAIAIGLTPECIKLVIKDRKSRIKAGVRKEECLMFRNIAGTEDAIADVVQEAAAIRARMRVKVMPAGKAEVLRATGRRDDPEQLPMRPVSEVIQAMRKVCG